MCLRRTHIQVCFIYCSVGLIFAVKGLGIANIQLDTGSVSDGKCHFYLICKLRCFHCVDSERDNDYDMLKV